VARKCVVLLVDFCVVYFTIYKNGILLFGGSNIQQSTDLNVYIVYGSISRKDYKLLLHKFEKKGDYQRNTKK